MKVRRHLGDVVLTDGVQSLQKPGATAIAFVKGQPAEPDVVGHSAVVLIQRDPPLGPMAQVFRNLRLRPALRILGLSVLGQKRLTIQHRVKVRRGIAQMDTDHAVVGLADGAAVLPLHASGLVALFEEAGLIKMPTACS